jgi:hypothetical protein
MARSFKKRALSPAMLQEVAAVTAAMPFSGEQALFSAQPAAASAACLLEEKQKFVPGQTLMHALADPMAAQPRATKSAMFMTLRSVPSSQTGSILGMSIPTWPSI